MAKVPKPLDINDLPPLITAGETATLLRCSKMTVYRLFRNGKLKGTTFGRSIRIRSECVRQMVVGGEQDVE